LGLLVDDFILVMEGMHEALADGLSPLQSAMRTLRDFALPSLSGTVTTLAAFSPIAMLGGMEGKFIRIIPLTICIALIASYLVSITVDTMVGAAWLRRAPPNALTGAVHRQFSRMVAFYATDIFPRTLRTRRQRWGVVGAAALAFGLSLGAATQLDAVLYPASDESRLGATLTLPPGTSLDQTRALSTEVEGLLAGDPAIRHFTLNAGARSGLAMSGPESYLEPFRDENILGVSIELVPKEDRVASSFELAETYRERLEGLARGAVEIHQVRMGASNSAPIEIEITARSVERAEALADEVLAVAGPVDGLVGLTDTRKPHQGAYRISLSDEALAFHHLDRGSVLQFLFTAIRGTTADTVYEGDDEVDIEVGYEWRHDGIWNSPTHLDEVLSLKVPGFLGDAVSLSGIAEVDLKTAPIGINHTNRRHVVSLRADAEGSPVEVANAIEARLANVGVALLPGESIAFLGDKASSAETNRELGRAFGIAVALIFSILVVQFRSFVQPFVLLLTMPLAMTGVFLGFFVT
ncbi:MAG: efflux RND transporter permease subunit, partial [Myxococcota bacterium]